MEKNAYRDKNNRYTRRVRVLYVCAVLLTAAMTIATYLYMQRMRLCLLIAAYGVLMIGITKMLQHTDDAYISSVVANLSELLDCLTELQQQEIFPDNEDSLVSKLQSKTNKLVTTLRLQNERERMEHENIKSLVSDLSHQLKTPIANLKMYTEFLNASDIASEERQQYLQVLNRSVDRLSFLAESMIKVSRLESGLITLHMEQQSINDTILQAVRDIYTTAKRAGIVIHYEEGVRCEVVHDRRWMAEACFNLLDNAVKYGTSDKEVILSIRELGLTIEICVTDENAPIPEEEQTHIFERFYRGRNASETEGVGIGLYLAREIVEKQGGCLSVRSTGTGNQFRVILPSSRVSVDRESVRKILGEKSYQ